MQVSITLFWHHCPSLSVIQPWFVLVSFFWAIKSVSWQNNHKKCHKECAHCGARLPATPPYYTSPPLQHSVRHRNTTSPKTKRHFAACAGRKGRKAESSIFINIPYPAFECDNSVGDSQQAVNNWQAALARAVLLLLSLLCHPVLLSLKIHHITSKGQ